MHSSVPVYQPCSQLLGRAVTLRVNETGTLRVNETGTFEHGDDLVGLHVYQNIDSSARPANLDPVSVLPAPKTEAESDIAMGQVAPAAQDLISKHQLPRLHSHPSADTVAIAVRTDGLYHQPVVAVATVIAEQGPFLVQVEDE